MPNMRYPGGGPGATGRDLGDSKLVDQPLRHPEVGGAGVNQGVGDLDAADVVVTDLALAAA